MKLYHVLIATSSNIADEAGELPYRSKYSDVAHPEGIRKSETL
jgi:hypothetical protein